MSAFFGETSLTFIQNLGSYSFIYIYWTVYCRRMHYHSFKSYWVVLSKYQKIMALLPFNFSWRKHILLMIIQKEFFFLLLSKLTQNNPINRKMSQDLLISDFFFFWKALLCDVKKDCMMPWSIFLKSLKTADISKNVAWKVFKLMIFEQQHNSFLLRDYSFKWDKWFRN